MPETASKALWETASKLAQHRDGVSVIDVLTVFRETMGETSITEDALIKAVQQEIDTLAH